MFVLDTDVYFGGLQLRSRGRTVVTDRLGSVRNPGGVPSRYFPYGEEEQVTTQDRDKFDGYYRDATSGLDFGGKRYYASALGVFVAPDQSKQCSANQNPELFNKYRFAAADPVTNSRGGVRIDQSGRFDDAGNTVVSYVKPS
jgi:RHS repeat-associated protein